MANNIESNLTYSNYYTFDDNILFDKTHEGNGK